MSDDPRIFLSYSRQDAAYAARQRKRIEAEQLSLWQDISHMEGGKWWDQILENLKKPSTDHMVLFVSPDALASGVVLDEWRIARGHGVQVHPVKVPGTLTPEHFDAMPRCMSDEHFYDLETPEQFNLLISNLKGASQQLNVPMLAPPPDKNFVNRPEQGDWLLSALLAEKDSRTVGITAALRGAGGYGKTQLARWLCQQERIVDRFCDGILWVELGEKPGMQGIIERLIVDLVREPTDKDRAFSSAAAAARRLMELLEKGGTSNKGRYLLVIDDAWRKGDVDLFMGGAPNTVRLVTTRLDETLPVGADTIPVDAMKPLEAVELLGVGLPREEVAAQQDTLRVLADRLGEWALLLALANGQLRVEVESGAPLSEAIAFVARVYDQMGLTAFDPASEDDRTRAAALSIEASLHHLTKDEVARFEQLAIFPEDEHIPAATIIRLWQGGGLEPLQGEMLLRKLKKFALLMSLDHSSGTVRLHDVMRKFLRDRAGRDGLVVHNKAWLVAYEGVDGKTLKGPEQLYYYRRRPLHLHGAEELAALEALLLDPGWMQEKLEALGEPLPLIEDYRPESYQEDTYREDSGGDDPPAFLERGKAARLTGQALELMAGPLARDPLQLIPQFQGRLRADLTDNQTEATALTELLRKTRPLVTTPALVPRWPRFTPPGGPEIRRFEGHSDGVRAVAFSPDGRSVLSGAGDNTLRLWDVASGEARVLEGHNNTVNAVAFSPDGRHVVSGTDDDTLRLWDVDSGEARVLEGHSDWVRAVAFSPDGRSVLSGTDDNTLRLWDVDSGRELARFDGDSGFNGLALSPDGRLLTAGDAGGAVHLFDVLYDEEGKQAWLKRCEGAEHNPHPGELQWYLHRDGKRHGPLTTSQLRQHHRQGNLHPTDLVWHKDLENWVRADRLKWKTRS